MPTPKLLVRRSKPSSAAAQQFEVCYLAEVELEIINEAAAIVFIHHH